MEGMKNVITKSKTARMILIAGFNKSLAEVELLMPSKSKKQQNFMAAVANNPKFAKKAGVPQSVGKDYVEADKMKGMKKYQAGVMKGHGREQGYNDRLDESMGAA